MRNLAVVILLAVAPWAAGAQESQTRNIGSFSGVKVTQGIDVYLKKGDKESARVEVNGVPANQVITEVSGSYLKVHMSDGNRRGNIDVKVYVTYVKINRLSASSGASIFSDGTISSNELEIGSSSGGTIEVAIETERADISASSAGEIELRGKAKSLTVDASSAGEVDAYDLESQNVTAEASSAGEVKVQVTTSLNANASSAGSIRYRGNPGKSMTNSSSGGSVRKSN